MSQGQPEGTSAGPTMDISVGDASKATAMLGQIKNPVPPRVGPRYHPGLYAISLVPTKALTLKLPGATLRLLVFMAFISAHIPNVTPAKAAFWVPMPVT